MVNLFYKNNFVSCQYRNVPNFSDIRKICSNLPKAQTKRQMLKVFYQTNANVIANSEDPDQTPPLGCTALFP